MTVDHILMWVSAWLIIVLIATMQWHQKLPKVGALQDLAAVVNSRGGNILVLGLFSFVFFLSALRFTYWFMEKAAAGKVSPQDALAMAAFTWMTGSAFGGSFTSMVKAMTGESSKARKSDGLPTVANTLSASGGDDGGGYDARRP